MKKLLLVAMILLSFTQLWGQQKEQNSLYYFNSLSYNPAYAGSRDALSLNLGHRIQWLGFDGAPQVTFLGLHSPIKNTHLSVGLDFTHDKVGISKKTGANLDVSYYVFLNDRGDRLSFGIKGGIFVFDAPLTQLNTKSADPDPYLYDINNELHSNFGAGVYWYGQNYFLGLSALSLLERSIIDNTKKSSDISVLNQKRHFYLTAGYVFDINPTLKLRPSAFLRYVSGAPMGIDAELAAFFYEKLWIGVGYRHGESVRGYMLAKLNANFSIGYNYDFVFNELGKYTSGTHEFVISYDFTFDKGKFRSPRYF